MKERLEKANEFINTIGSCGRRFFNHNGEVSRLEVDARGRVWFIDSYSKKRVYTHYRFEWRGFTNGGTLRCLIAYLRDYIKRGERFYIPSFHYWGYDENAMAIVKHKAVELGLLK
jgi:hypothetical protein